MRNALASGMAIALAFMLSTTARAATITVDSLADTAAPGICVLRDAITAANTKTATNGCAAGTGNDTIQFSVTGTITLGSTLPQITDSKLAISGPPSPGLTIDGGGAVEVMAVATGATVKLNKLRILHGFINSFPAGGGGIFNDGTLTVTDCTFSGNVAKKGNGGGIANFGTLTITNSTFSGNSVTGQGYGENGGAISTFGNTTVLTATNSTFSRNSVGGTASIGGGVYEDAGTVAITNSTFSGNSADSGSIYNVCYEPASVKSTILVASGGGDCSGQITDTGYNISDDSTCNFSATGSSKNTDPMLDPAGLQNNGGPTKTIALLDGSPAIDAIPLADCTDQASPPKPIITDQRLFPRPDAEEVNCDIGAYEFQDTTFIPLPAFTAA
jgi:hypothetical protein